MIPFPCRVAASILSTFRLSSRAKCKRQTADEGGSTMAEPVRIAVTRLIPEAGLALLRDAETAGEIEIRLWREDLPPSPDKLADLLHGCAGALTLVTDRIDGAVLDREPQLKVVSNFAVGYDNVDVPAATARGV